MASVTVVCPHCKRKHVIDTDVFGAAAVIQASRERNVRQFQAKTGFRLATGEPPAELPAGLHVSRETPVFMPTMEANIIVPRAKAVTYGFFVGGAGFVVVAGPLIMGGARVWDALAAGGTIGGVAFFITSAWAWHTSSRFYDTLLTRFEEMTGQDVNGDGQVGRDSVDVNVTDDKGNRKTETWPVSKLALVQFAKSVVSDSPNDTFSESTAREAGISRAAWETVRDRFLTNGWAHWRNPANRRQGLELSPHGGRILRAIAREMLPDGIAAAGDNLMTPHETEKGTGRGNW